MREHCCRESANRQEAEAHEDRGEPLWQPGARRREEPVAVPGGEQDDADDGDPGTVWTDDVPMPGWPPMPTRAAIGGASTAR